jgi:uncharacterized RmlC-like cupin family protein
MTIRRKQGACWQQSLKAGWGSEALWAGFMLAEPNTTSSVHHHGSLETVVYVIAGVS